MITNRMNLPEPLVKAIAFDDYTGGGADISATSLWKPARMVALEKQHGDKITQDVSDMIWILMGKCIHEILRRSDQDAVTETRLADEVLGWKVSGQFDRFVTNQGLLQDYKITSAWSLVFSSRDDEWTKQLNTYAYLLRRNGHEVRRIEIVAILRDWSATQAKSNKDYPQSSVQVIPIQLWEEDRIVRLLQERVREHQRARMELPLCSEEEQWAKPTVYAVMKEGRKSALKLCSSEEEARTLLDEKGTYLQVRPGEKTRCESYCQVRDFCEQYQREKEGRKHHD